METNDNSNLSLPSGKRPQALKILCILTFVSTGFSLISSFFSLISGPMSSELLEEQKVNMIKMVDELNSLELYSLATMMEQIQRMTASVNTQFYAVTMVSFLVVALGLVGAVFMWQGKKLGFHLYIIYSLFAIIQLYFFVSPADIPIYVVVANLLFSILFVLLYSRNLKWLK